MAKHSSAKAKPADDRVCLAACWFLILERARAELSLATAAHAQRVLRGLGIIVTYACPIEGEGRGHRRD